MDASNLSASGLELVPPRKRPVVLGSGGPIMELEVVLPDGKGLCRWRDNSNRINRAVLPLLCLYSCVPAVFEPDEPETLEG